MLASGVNEVEEEARDFEHDSEAEAELDVDSTTLSFFREGELVVSPE